MNIHMLRSAVLGNAIMQEWNTPVKNLYPSIFLIARNKRYTQDAVRWTLDAMSDTLTQCAVVFGFP